MPIAHSLPRLGAHCKQIYTTYKSMRQCGYAHASDKLQWGREPGLLGRPAIPLGQPPTPPSVTPSLSPPVTLPLSQVERRCGGSSPAVLRPAVGAAWPERPSHPSVGGLQEASRADTSLRWAPSCQPPGHLQASAALPCSSPAPKQALGSSGGSGAPPPSRALRFFDIWSVFGS